MSSSDANLLCHTCELFDSMQVSDNQGTEGSLAIIQAELVKLELSRWLPAVKAVHRNQGQTQGLAFRTTLQQISQYLLSRTADPVDARPSQQQTVVDTDIAGKIRQRYSMHLDNHSGIVHWQKTYLLTFEELSMVANWINDGEPKGLLEELSKLRNEDAQWLRKRIPELGKLRTAAKVVDPELAKLLPTNAQLSFSHTVAEENSFIYQGAGFDDDFKGLDNFSNCPSIICVDQTATGEATIVQGPMVKAFLSKILTTRKAPR